MPSSPDTTHAFLAEYGDVPVCGRCLVVIDSRMRILAKHPKHGLHVFERVTDMAALKAWVIEKILNGLWRFEVNDSNGRFVPISTWHGDPVCRWHLYVLGERELRTGR